MVHAPLLLYHEVQHEPEKDLPAITNIAILLFIKLYDPKTENLVVNGLHPQGFFSMAWH